MRVEINTEDFDNLKLAHERGWLHKNFFCTTCGLLIRTESWEGNHMFGGGTVMKNNKTPKFCPDCGHRLEHNQVGE